MSWWRRFLCSVFGHRAKVSEVVPCWFVVERLEKCERCGDEKFERVFGPF
jgi:hypothetical protein